MGWLVWLLVMFVSRTTTMIGQSSWDFTSGGTTERWPEVPEIVNTLIFGVGSDCNRKCRKRIDSSNCRSWQKNVWSSQGILKIIRHWTALTVSKSFYRCNLSYLLLWFSMMDLPVIQNHKYFPTKDFHRLCLSNFMHISRGSKQPCGICV